MTVADLPPESWTRDYGRTGRESWTAAARGTPPSCTRGSGGLTGGTGGTAPALRSPRWARLLSTCSVRSCGKVLPALTPRCPWCRPVLTLKHNQLLQHTKPSRNNKTRSGKQSEMEVRTKYCSKYLTDELNRWKS